MRIRLYAGAAAVLALFALAACRSAPNVAAYVGDTVITEQQITDLTDGYNAKAPQDRKVTRDLVMEYALGERLCNRASEAKKFSYQPPSVPDESPEFLKIASRFEACIEAIPVSAATEAEIRAVYNLEVAEGRLSPDVPFEQVRKSIEGNENLQRQLTWRRTLSEQDKAANVVINPRYPQPFWAGGGDRAVINRLVEQPQQ